MIKVTDFTDEKHEADDDSLPSSPCVHSTGPRAYVQNAPVCTGTTCPLIVGQDRLEPLTIKRMRLPRNAGGFDATPVLLRSPMAFLAQYLAIASIVVKTAGVRAMETLGIVEAARNPKGRLRLMGLSIDERRMPREGPRTERWTFPVWVTRH